MGLTRFISVLICFSCIHISYAEVSLTFNGLEVVIKNDYVTLNFRNNSRIRSLYVGDTNIIHRSSNSFYMDWMKSTHIFFKPTSVHVVENTTSRVHFYWLQDQLEDEYKMEMHYIMTDDLSGIYSYVKVINDQELNFTTAESRMVYRYNATILTQGTNQERSGTIPNGRELENCTSVQDATCRFPNGTYYTKYDYAAYIKQTNYQGLYGNGHGAFLISPSREYHSGGPLRQDITVHEECLITNYFSSTHFGSSVVRGPLGWTHIYGPFLHYYPTGTSDDDIMSKVVKQVEIEKASWPYSWMNDTEYPLERAHVSGSVSGQSNATIVIWDSLDEEFDDNSYGYLYTTNTDAEGNYIIKNIRPGTYRMAAFPRAGLGTDSLDETNVTLEANENAKVNFALEEPTDILWSIGEANRLSSEFKYSNELRNYQWEWKPPATLNFTIGQSNPAEDWYYAQSLAGHWYIIYEDTNDNKDRILRLGIAGSTKSHLQVLVNGKRVANLYFKNDSSVYRSATQSGKYHSQVITIPSSYVVTGNNTIHLWLSQGQIMYDCISLQTGQ